MAMQGRVVVIRRGREGGYVHYTVYQTCVPTNPCGISVLYTYIQHHHDILIVCGVVYTGFLYMGLVHDSTLDGVSVPTLGMCAVHCTNWLTSGGVR